MTEIAGLPRNKLTVTLQPAGSRDLWGFGTFEGVEELIKEMRGPEQTA